MQNEQLTWHLIDREAEVLGANNEARRKWRQAGRRVPFEWRMKLIEAFAGRGIAVSQSDFDSLPANPGRIISEQAA